MQAAGQAFVVEIKAFFQRIAAEPWERAGAVPPAHCRCLDSPAGIACQILPGAERARFAWRASQGAGGRFFMLG
jgi:hypothetical protein